jgi:hypothetical protein
MSSCCGALPHTLLEPVDCHAAALAPHSVRFRVVGSGAAWLRHVVPRPNGQAKAAVEEFALSTC